MEVWRESKLVFEGTVINLRVGEVTLDDGAPAYREVVEHKGGVCILPFTGTSVVLVRQFRIAMGEYVLEAPAGKVEAHDAHPEARAAAELEEECGFRAGQLISTGITYASVGYCTERIHNFLALDLVRTARNLDPEERIELVEIPLDEVRAMLTRHEIPDAKTIVLLHALFNHLEGGAPKPAANPQ
jgi:ADP-ribose pyrophosphatase